MRHPYDIILIGGGIMGSATAYHLLSFDRRVKVAVVEKDPSYTYASTALSLGGIRIQFTLKDNIFISLHAQDVYSRFEEEMAVGDERPFINYRQEGYLFLIEDMGRPAAEKAMALQKQMGCQVEWLSREEIGERFPILCPEGFCGGTFGPKDGYLDPYAVLMGYRTKAKSLGAEFLNDDAVKILRSPNRVEGVRLKSGKDLITQTVVNAAGPWAGVVAKTADVELPIVPVKRQVFACKPAISLDRALPLVILPSNLYFRTETGGLILTGKSLEEDKKDFEFSWEMDRFTETIWPELAQVVPDFQALKVVRGWAGLYEVNLFDHNAIIGSWPELKGLYLINGFSGHGVQQAPAAGRYLAELILRRTPVLDLSALSPLRILEKKRLLEEGVV